jgi:PhoD-like phosphatase
MVSTALLGAYMRCCVMQLYYDCCTHPLATLSCGSHCNASCTTATLSYTGAQNHQPATEGEWTPRRAAAFRALFEHLPTRQFEGQSERVYREFTYGKMLHICMIDTRYPREQQVRHSTHFTIRHITHFIVNWIILSRI